MIALLKKKKKQDLEYRMKWDHYCLQAGVVEEKEDTACVYWAGNDRVS